MRMQNKTFEPYMKAMNMKTNPLEPYQKAMMKSAPLVQPITEQAQPSALQRAYGNPNANPSSAQPQSAVARAYSGVLPSSGNNGNNITQPPVSPSLMNTRGTESAVPQAQENKPTVLQQAYGGSYGTQRQNALQQADIGYNKLLNYLPEYLESVGLRGAGVANQALMNAYGKHQQGIADINAQYDELDRMGKDEQINRINVLGQNISAFLSGSESQVSRDDYERFVQGLIQSGYTQEEIRAAENILSKDEYNKIPVSVDFDTQYNITGRGISVSDAKETDFGEYQDTGKSGSGQNTLVTDILSAARAGKIENGSIVDFNYGKHAKEKFYVYYDGHFYEINAADVDPKKDKIIGRGRNETESTYVQSPTYYQELAQLSPAERAQREYEERIKMESSKRKVYGSYIDPNDL